MKSEYIGWKKSAGLRLDGESYGAAALVASVLSVSLHHWLNIRGPALDAHAIDINSLVGSSILLSNGIIFGISIASLAARKLGYLMLLSWIILAVFEQTFLMLTMAELIYLAIIYYPLTIIGVLASILWVKRKPPLCS